MATSLALRLEKHGRVETPVSNVPFPVEDPNSVWIVRAGKLDLFTVQKRNEASCSAPVITYCG